MHRRGAAVLAIVSLLGVLSTSPEAQTPPAAEGKRIGWLTTEQASPALTAYRDTLRQALVGHVNLRQVTFEERLGVRVDQLRASASQLVRLKVNAILAVGHEAGRAALQATSSIPIVVLASDPVAAGLVKSFDDPGANVTGVAFDAAELSHRRLQILKELVPKLSIVGVIGHGGPGSGTAEAQAIAAAARGLGLETRPLDADDARTLRLALAAVPTKPEALLVPVEPWMVGDARGVSETAAKQRLPAVYPFSEFTDEGGLVAYGPNLHAMYRRAGSYLGRVMNGARPRDLPLERPSRAELIVNLRAARALGLTVPRSLLGAADRILE